MRTLILGVTAALALTAASGEARANVRIFSYDPANEVTRRAAGDLTFEFNQRLVFTTILRIRSTQGQASAAVKPVDEHVLGPGGLSRLIGKTAQERDLYEVESSDEGADLIKAFCPGSKRAWLAFSRLYQDRPLRVQVIGDDPAGGPTRLCETLDFTFHGEWRLPPGESIQMGDMLQPGFPY